MKTLQELIDMPIGRVTKSDADSTIERVHGGWVWGGGFVPIPLSAQSADVLKDAWKAAKKAAKKFPDHPKVGK